ncbi:winged helix-turn-helix domain-containing protein [Salinifilum ghardaiensis]
MDRARAETSGSTTERADRRTATVDVVIPVHNEERALPGSVRTLSAHLGERFPFRWSITIADNASTDRTAHVAHDLAASLANVRVLRLDRKGRGLALRTAWGYSDADVVAYMDVDLSTGLDALLPLVAPLVNGHSDVAVGSRLAPGARTVRGGKREIVSRGYNALLRWTHGARFTDAQCGFKAARTAAVRPVLERVVDDSWFFDTELLLLAEHNGLRVHEVPVDWVEDLDSRVEVARTAFDDVKGRLRYHDLELDEDTCEVRRGGRPVDLSPTEFKLLRYLLVNAEEVVSKIQILDRVWSYEFGGDGRIVESYISYLRRKVDTGEPPLIHTVRGVGYVLRLPRDGA